MKFLKGLSVNLVVGFNVFILFLLLFEKRIAIPPLLQAAGRMHPLLLHFPIVLLILAAVFEFFENRFGIDKQAVRKVTRFLLCSGAVSALLTATFGLFLSKEEGYAGKLLEWHKWSGVAVSFAASLLLWRYRTDTPRRFLRAGLLVVLSLLIATGHWGAALTHGDNFISEPVVSRKKGRPDLQNAVIYQDLVVPVLKEKCFSCHNPDKAKGKLVMTDTAALKRGGQSGALYIPQQSGKSLLVERLLLDINHKHRMPPKGKPQLSDTEVALIKAWIDVGGSFSARLTAFPEAHKIHELAATLYGTGPEEEFAFAAPDKELVQRLNNSYRLIAPVSLNSPALDVTFFNRSSFSPKSLEEIAPIQTQVVGLNFSGMNLGDAALPLVSQFGNLRRLNLNYTEITDEGLQHLGPFANLQSLMVTGTNITVNGLASFLNRSKLRHVYAWNTAVTRHEADSLALKYPGLRIETGFYDDSQERLRLNPPQITPGHAFFRQRFHLEMRHPVAGTTVLYTLDGAVPDSSRSSVFRQPVTLDKNTVVKAMAVKKGWADSEVVERHFKRSSLLPDTFALLTFPDPHHKGRGAPTLFDLEAGSTDILYASDGKWLGYQTGDFILDLGFHKPVVINSIELSTLLSVDLESFPPLEIQVWGGGKDAGLQLIGQVRPAVPAGKMPVKQNLINCPLTIVRPLSRYRIIAKPLHKLPPWHPNAGKPAWFFVDEILLN